MIETFNAKITLMVQFDENEKIVNIEKPSKRLVTYKECHSFINKLKNDYGTCLKRIVLVDADTQEFKSRWSCKEWS